MLIIAESQHVFNAHDIRACYWTEGKGGMVYVHIGYPSDQPIKPDCDHQCTVHNVIYKSADIDLCLSLIQCITASLINSDCKVFDVNANVERIALLAKWLDNVVSIVEQMIERGEQPDTVFVTLGLERIMEEYHHIYDQDASKLVSLMIEAGILSLEDEEISIGGEAPHGG